MPQFRVHEVGVFVATLLLSHYLHGAGAKSGDEWKSRVIYQVCIVGHRHRSYRIKARIDIFNAWLMFLRCVEQVPML